MIFFGNRLNRLIFLHHFQLSDVFLERVPVEAKDFKLYYDACMNKHVTNSGAKSSKTYLRDIIDFTIINPTQFIVSWKADTNTGQSKYTSFQQTAYLKPLPYHVFTKYADGNDIIITDDYKTNSAWAQAIKEHWSQQTIVSCGPWILKRKNDSLLVFEKTQHTRIKNKRSTTKNVFMLSMMMVVHGNNFKTINSTLMY